MERFITGPAVQGPELYRLLMQGRPPGDMRQSALENGVFLLAFTEDRKLIAWLQLMLIDGAFRGPTALAAHYFIDSEHARTNVFTAVVTDALMLVRREYCAAYLMGTALEIETAKAWGVVGNYAKASEDVWMTYAPTITIPAIERQRTMTEGQGAFPSLLRYESRWPLTRYRF